MRFAFIAKHRHIWPVSWLCEVLRALDALQTASRKGVATPANWTVGQDVIVPLALDDAAAEKKFGQINKVLPYLRYAKLPK